MLEIQNFEVTKIETNIIAKLIKDNTVDARTSIF